MRIDAARKFKASLIGVMVLLVLVIGFLLVGNYRYKVQLQQASMQRLQYDAEKLAMAMSFFFSERRQDLADFSIGRELAVYFEGKALGMSMTYGLRAALVAVDGGLTELTERRRIGGQRVFRSISLYGDEGAALAVSRPGGMAPDAVVSGGGGWPDPFLRLQMRLVANDGDPLIILAMPVFFKGRRVGHLAGEVPVMPVFSNLVRLGAGHLLDREYAIVGHDMNIPLTRGLLAGGGGSALNPDLVKPGRPFLFDAGPGERGSGQPVLGVGTVIRDTPFILVSAMARDSAGANPMPWVAPAALGFISMVAIAALAGLWRMGTQTAVLNARFEAAAKAKKEIELQKQLLEAEIGERQRAERFLIESEQRLDLALFGGSLGVWDWHVTGDRLVISGHWSEILGHNSRELTTSSRDLRRFVHPEDWDQSIGKLHAHLGGQNEYFESEHRVKTSGGEWKWLFNRGRIVARDDRNNPTRVSGTFQDITARKTAETELQHYRVSLEDQVAERTRELEEAQAALVNKAVDAGRAQLSAMVLHNIGNAITPVSVNLEQLKELNTSPAVDYLRRCYSEFSAHHGDLGRFVRDTRRGAELFSYTGTLVEAMGRDQARFRDLVGQIETGLLYISEIITLQQVYAASEEVHRELLDFNVVVSDAARMQRGALSRRRIDLVLDLAPRLPRVLLDRNRLMQVVVNLVKNAYEAIDARDEGGERRITLQTRSTGDRVHLEIVDTGTGIDPEVMMHIGSLGHSSKGSSGFGVSYCRLFVEQNGGVFSIANTKGASGVTVRLSFSSGAKPIDTVH